MADHISIHDEDRVKVVRFNRPEKKNAITQSMYAAIADAMAEAEERGFAAIVFLGAGGIFTAGNDIADFMTSAMTSDFANSPTLRFLRALAGAKIPLVAGVGGVAVGVGTTMLLHCDMVFSSPRASFKTPFLNLGLVPEAASSLLAPRIMGPQRAFEMLALGETFSAEDAQRAGFVNRIVDEEKLEERSLDAARKLAALPPEALRLSRALLRGGEDAILKRIDEEADLFVDRLKSAEAREAFSAFMEKRPPDFKKNAP